MNKQELVELIINNIDNFKYTQSPAGYTKAIYLKVGNIRYYATHTILDDLNLHVEKVGWIFCKPEFRRL